MEGGWPWSRRLAGHWPRVAERMAAEGARVVAALDASILKRRKPRSQARGQLRRLVGDVMTSHFAQPSSRRRRALLPIDISDVVGGARNARSVGDERRGWDHTRAGTCAPCFWLHAGAVRAVKQRYARWCIIGRAQGTRDRVLRGGSLIDGERRACMPSSATWRGFLPPDGINVTRGAGRQSTRTGPARISSTWTSRSSALE